MKAGALVVAVLVGVGCAYMTYKLRHELLNRVVREGD